MLLGPLTSFLPVTAVSVVVPSYNTFKALQSKDEAALKRYLCYWLIFAAYTLVAPIVDTVGSFLPFFYYELKIGFFVWLTMERFDGAGKLYAKAEPFLKTYEPEVDKAIAEAVKMAKNFKVEDINALVTFVSEKVNGAAAAPAEKAKAAPAVEEQKESPADEPTKGTTEKKEE